MLLNTLIILLTPNYHTYTFSTIQLKLLNIIFKSTLFLFTLFLGNGTQQKSRNMEVILHSTWSLSSLLPYPIGLQVLPTLHLKHLSQFSRLFIPITTIPHLFYIIIHLVQSIVSLPDSHLKLTPFLIDSILPLK